MHQREPLDTKFLTVCQTLSVHNTLYP